MSLALIRGDGSQISIPEKTFHSWQADFPGLDIKEEILKANSWMARNKSKSWKTTAGFVGWLKRAHSSSPRVAADKKTKGQIAYRERIQRENNERQALEDKIPRPSAEQVREICGQLRSSLPAYERVEPKRVDWLRCHHEWGTSFYGGGEWCEKCGAFRGQWRAV